MEQRVLLADLGQAWFGMELATVAEVFLLPPPARVPRSAPWILGLLNHHGRLITLVDLGQFLGLGSGQVSRVGVVILVDRPELNLGLAAISVQVVEGRDIVETTKARQFVGDTGWIIGSRSTPELDFQLLDVGRIVQSIMSPGG